MSKLRELSTLVSVTRASILIIERFVNAFSLKTDCAKVPFRIQRLDDLYKRHMAALDDLELSSTESDTLEEYAQERDEMEDRYHRLRDFLVAHKPTTAEPVSAPGTPSDSILSCSVCSRPRRAAECAQYRHLP